MNPYFYYAELDGKKTWVREREAARVMTRHQCEKLVRKLPASLTYEIVRLPRQKK